MNKYPSAICILPQGVVHLVEDKDITYIKIKSTMFLQDGTVFTSINTEFKRWMHFLLRSLQSFGAPHGGPNNCACFRHVGDLGNVYADQNGVVDTIPWIHMSA